MSSDRDFEAELAVAFDRVPDDAKAHCEVLHSLAREMAEEINSLRSDLGDAEDRADEADHVQAQNIVQDWMTDLQGAVERPVGKLEFIVKNPKLFNRAILALFDRARVNVMGA